MKLEFFKVKNYKSIVDFECRFGSGVNVFTGPSDSGKSNVIRALRDFFFNAKGDDVITAKKDKCTVVVNDCIWNKGKGVNQYVTPEGTYENVGRTSPQQLRERFKIDEIAWDENNTKKLQFIQQHDPKFFLDESYTGSLNAKILGLVSGIQRTYNGNRLVLGDIKDAKSRKESLEIACKQSEQELKKYASLPKKAKLITAIKTVMTDLEKIENKHNSISGLFISISSTKEMITELEETICPPIDTCNLADLQTLMDQINKLSKLYGEVLDLKHEIKNIGEIDGIEIDPDTTIELKEKFEKIERIKETLDTINSIKSEYQSNNAEMTDLESEKSELETDLHSAIQTMDLCPLTKNEFCDGCKDKIIGDCKCLTSPS